jgi:hypothetical protein
MAQADYVVANGTGAAVRSDLNGQLAAIVSNNSGVTEPSTTYAYQWWADTTTGLLKLRNAANNAWITLFQLDGEWTTLAIENGTAAAPSLYFKDSGTDTGLFSPGTDQFGIATGGVERVEFGTSEVVFNDGGANYDFRIEGDTNPGLFKIDAGLDEVQVANLNGGPLAGFRNRIINGDFDFWQRGTSFTGNEYGADRWNNTIIGSACTMSRQPFTLGQTDVPGEPLYFCRMAVTSVAGAGNIANLHQRIEGVRTFAGQQVTVSFWAKADAAKPISVELIQYFGSGGSPSASVDTIGTTKTTLSTSWQKVTVTATVPSISGKTLGTNGDSLLQFNIWFDAGSDFNSRTDSLGQQSGTFEIAQVQLEPGPVATPFEQRPIGTELALCQRYYQTTGGVGRAGSASTVESYCKLSPQMRSSPTISIATSTGCCVQLGRPDANINSVTGFFQISSQGIGVTVSSSDTGMGPGAVAMIRDIGLAATAEL